MNFYSKMVAKPWANQVFKLLLLVILSSCNSDEGIVTDISKEEEKPIDPIDTSIDGLPLFLINTNGTTIVDEPKISADVTVRKDGSVDFSGKIGIEIRGSTSQFFPKKSYGFETWDDSDQDVDASILGFPEEEDWILYGPYSDKVLMRNTLIYDLSREMNQYASRTEFVELNLNGAYQGVYVFMEKLKRDKERIDMPNKMIHADNRNLKSYTNRFCHSNTLHQTYSKTRSRSYRYCF